MSYRTAKADMIRRWTPLRNGQYTVCAVCGLLIGSAPVCHHWLESRRYDKCSQFNLCPVHGEHESGCHTVAHTRQGRLIIANSVYLVWGQGDRRAGREMIVEAVAERNHRKPPDIPPVSQEEAVLVVCRRIAAQMGFEMVETGKETQ